MSSPRPCFAWPRPLSSPAAARLVTQESGRALAQRSCSCRRLICLSTFPPHALAGLEAEALEGDRDLGHPAVRVDARPRIPDPVPLVAQVLAIVRDLAV